MKYLKYAIFGIAIGILFAFIHIENFNSITYSELILKISFSEYILTPNNASYFDKITLCYFPLIVFQVIAGTEIYRHYCTGAIYYFSRCVNRLKWYFKEIGCLSLQTLIYLLSYVLGYMIFDSLVYDIIFDIASIKLFIYFILIYYLWNFIFSLLINVTALFAKSNGGFAISIGLQLLFLSLYVAFQEKLYLIYENDIISKLLIKVIPFSHLILSWHSSKDHTINSLINIYEMSYDLNYSVISLLILSITIMVIGAFIIKRIDFIYSNRENGG